MRNTPPPPRRVRSAHESKSATVRAAAAAPSRRQQSRWQREQGQQRAFYIAIAGLVAVIAAIFAGGLVYENVIRANETVAVVGSETITASNLVDAMRPEARRIETLARQQGASNPQVAQYVDQQKRQLPDQLVNELIDIRLVEQEAARLGVSVSTAEVDERVRTFVAEFNASSNPTPTAEPTSTPEAAVATPAAQTAPTPAPSPTAVPTLDAAAYPAALQQMLERYSYTEPDFRQVIERGVLREKVEEAFGKERVPDTQEQIRARHILVPSPDQAQDVVQQLMSGADFGELAQQRSTDPGSNSKGGDLGWFTRGVMDKTFEDAAFALEPGQLSGVIQTSNGYHVIQLLERDPARAVSESDLERLRQRAFSDWLDQQRSSSNVRLELSPGERDWALARIGVRP